MKNVVIVRDPNYLKPYYGKRSSSSDGRFFQDAMPKQVAMRAIRAALCCFEQGTKVTAYLKNTPALSVDKFKHVDVQEYQANIKRDLLVFVSDNAELSKSYADSIVVDTAHSRVIGVGENIESQLSTYTDNPQRALDDLLGQYRKDPHTGNLWHRFNYSSAVSFW